MKCPVIFCREETKGRRHVELGEWSGGACVGKKVVVGCLMCHASDDVWGTVGQLIMVSLSSRLSALGFQSLVEGKE